MAVVYKISCLDESVKECYIGSTTDFKTRMRQHNNSCNNENSNKYKYNQPLYKFIRENGGWGAWKMTIIDSLTTTDKNEKEKCERKYIEEQEFSLNKIIPTRTPKEYYQDHREKRKQYHLDHKEKLNEKCRLYHLDHKEKLNEKGRLYYQDHKEEIIEYQKQYAQDHKEEIANRKKQYYHDHKEEINEKKKQYRETNRETISKQRNEKIQCERCGDFSTRSNLARHQRTMRCINYTTK